jgi:hypothetical protein
VNVTYQYQNQAGLLSNLNPLYLFNTQEKLVTLFYSFASVGFLPLLNPLTLILIFTHFTTFFVIASDLPGAPPSMIATAEFVVPKSIPIILLICF